MKIRLVFVGGIGGSGKSLLASDISAAFAAPVFSLDRIHMPFADLTATDAIDRDLSFQLSRSLSLNILHQFLAVDTRVIVEGAWVRAEEIRHLTDNPKFKAVFLGYPNVTPEARVEYYKNSAHGHWLANLGHEDAIRTVTSHIDYCKKEESVCNHYGIDFIDTSDFLSDEFVNNRKRIISEFAQII